MYRSHLLQNLHPCGEGQQPQDRLCTTIPRPSEVGRNKPATQIRVADLDFLDPNDPDVDDTPEVEVELKRAIFMNISDLRKHVQNVPQRPSSRQASLAPSSSNSSSTISSVSTNTSAGSRPMRLRILSVIEGCDPRLAGHVTPITNDSYDDLVSTIKLIHEIEGDIELVRRQSGDKLSQATVADLRKDEVVDVKILPNGPCRSSLKDITDITDIPPQRPPPKDLPPPRPPRRTGVPRRPPPPLGLVLPPTVSNTPPSNGPSRAVPHHVVSSTRATRPDSPSMTSRPTSPPARPFTPPISPPPYGGHTGVPSQYRSLHSQRLGSTSPLQINPPVPQRSPSRQMSVRSQTTSQPPRYSTLTSARLLTESPRNSSSLWSTSSSSTVTAPAPAPAPAPAQSLTFTDFHIIITPPVCKKGHRSVFPIQPFKLTRADHGVFPYSTVSAVKALLKKRFKKCPDIAIYFNDEELTDERKSLCDLGIEKGSNLILVDKDQNMVLSRLQNRLLQMG